MTIDIDFEEESLAFWVVKDAGPVSKTIHNKKSCVRLLLSEVSPLSQRDYDLLKKIGYKDCSRCFQEPFVLPDELKILEDLFIPEGFKIKIMYRDPTNKFGNYKTVYDRGTDQV